MSQYGYYAWKPSREYAPLLEQVLDVMEEGRADWPLSQRYWLYRLMAKHKWIKEWECYSPSKAAEFIEKCDAARARGDGKPKARTDGGGLQLILDRGRRSGLIPWEAVQSSRGFLSEPYTFDGREGMIEELEASLQVMKLDRQSGQAQRLILWVETTGLAEKLGGICSKYSIEVRSGSGFDTIGFKHDFAMRVAASDLPVVVLHFGDLDRSGKQIQTSLDDDVSAFVMGEGGSMTIERLALLDHHIDEYGLQWDKPKVTKANHSTGEKMPRSAQLEALTFTELRALISYEIESRLDMDIYQAVLEEEHLVRARLTEDLRSVLGPNP